MANVTMTTRFSQMKEWPGHLLEADGNETIGNRTATNLTFRFGSGHDFEGYTVSISGTGFTWNDGEATGGRVQSLVIRNGAGNVIFSVTGITAGTLGSDLTQLHSAIFGAAGQTNPDLWSAWNFLMSGNDTITGTNQDDWNFPPGENGGNNLYNLLGGNDWTWVGSGRDTINGGAGDDTISFIETHYNQGATATRGAVINVKTGTIIDPWGSTDRFTSIERFEGSRFADQFIGGAGRDRFTGGRGADTINGGGDTDEARYGNDYQRGATLGIIANLQTAVSSGNILGTVRDGFGQTDRLINVERVEGTRFNDRFTGSSQNNHFWGGEGLDRFDGKGGYDLLRMERQFNDGVWMVGIHVDLALASGQIVNDGFGNTETALNFEGVIGSNQGDLIRGNAVGNLIEGGLGSDTLTGRGGHDEFSWYSEEEIGDGDVITDFTLNGTGSDLLVFESDNFSGMTNTVRLVNGPAATIAQGQFVFNASNDTLYWDPDGTGSRAAIVIAQLQGVNALTVGDFLLY